MWMPNRTLGASIVLLLCLLMHSAARADQLVMKNGDTITGKITRVEGSEVDIDPAYAQKFTVKREAVASIITDKPLEVEMLDGSRINARFAGTDEASRIILADEQDEILPVDRVYKAAPPRKFYKRESHVDALMTLNEGNTNNRSAVINLDTRLRLGDHRQFASVTVRRDENEGVSTKKQNLAYYEYDWLFRRAWYLAATAAYERDPIRELGHRFTFGALLGHDFFDASDLFLTIKAGAGYTDEDLGGVPSNGPVGLWEFEYRQKFGNQRLELLHNNAMTYQDYGENNLILKSETTVRYDLLWDIYATASYLYNYETEPAPGRFGKDSTLAFGLGAKF